MKEVYRGSPVECAHIRNLLEAAGIIVYQTNELMSSIEPYLAVPMILQVDEQHFDRAMDVLTANDDEN